MVTLSNAPLAYVISNTAPVPVPPCVTPETPVKERLPFQCAPATVKVSIAPLASTVLIVIRISFVATWPPTALPLIEILSPAK